MSLFFVLIVAGKVAGTWGPLPYDIGECQRRRDEALEQFALHEKTKNWRAACQWRFARPALGEPVTEAQP